MAEGFATHYGAGRVEAHSAGMEPRHLNPNAVAVMRERGIDISGQQSKAFNEAVARQMDYVITVCGNADERCPVLPVEVQRLHWPLEDPARARGAPQEILAMFHRSRDEIEPLVRDFVGKALTAGKL
jgi:arsenate reductase